MTLPQIKKQRKHNEAIIVLGIFLAVIFGLAMINNTVFIIPMLLGVGLAGFGFHRNQKLSLIYKEHHLKQTIEENFPNCTYTPSKGFDKEFITESKIVKGNIFKSEDFLEGTFEGYAFKSADVHLQERRSSGKSSYTVTTFQGRFYVVDFPRRFPEDVYIMPTPSFWFSPFSDIKKIPLESVDFNRAFNVYSKDQHSAFYLMTPRFMEKIVEFSSKYDKVTYAFKNNEILIAVDYRSDNFDFKFADELEDFYVKHIERELNLLKDMMQIIRKNASTF